MAGMKGKKKMQNCTGVAQSCYCPVWYPVTGEAFITECHITPIIEINLERMLRFCKFPQNMVVMPACAIQNVLLNLILWDRCLAFFIEKVFNETWSRHVWLWDL